MNQNNTKNEVCKDFMKEYNITNVQTCDTIVLEYENRHRIEHSLGTLLDLIDSDESDMDAKVRMEHIVYHIGVLTTLLKHTECKIEKNHHLYYHVGAMSSLINGVAKNGKSQHGGQYSTNEDINDAIKKAEIAYRNIEKDISFMITQSGITIKNEKIISGLDIEVCHKIDGVYKKHFPIELNLDKVMNSFTSSTDGIKKYGALLTYISRYTKMMVFRVGIEDISEDIDALIEDSKNKNKPASQWKEQQLDMSDATREDYGI